MAEFQRRVATSRKKRRQNMDVRLVFGGVDIRFHAARAVVFLLHL